jgi:hypothetical protein
VPTLPPETVTLSLAQARLLLQAALPLPVLDVPAVVALIAYQQRRKLAAYRSQRQRILLRLAPRASPLPKVS